MPLRVHYFIKITQLFVGVVKFLDSNQNQPEIQLLAFERTKFTVSLPTFKIMLLAVKRKHMMLYIEE